jgi:D-alanine-D-alanine ligase
MKKINVVVLMGGKSSEHEISLISGREIVRSLDPKKYQTFPIVISKDGKTWRLTSSQSLLSFSDPIKLRGTKKELITQDSREVKGLGEVAKRGIDTVFIAMHGPFGEDGTVQGMLELAGVKYTGAGVLASSLGMDKIMFRKVLSYHKIPMPNYIVVKKGEGLDKVDKVLGKPPYFVKPNNQGSSIGISKVEGKKDLKKALNNAFNYSDLALIEEYLKGKEVTCAIMGNEKPIALPIIEIIPHKGKFFNYESKYYEGGSDEIVPARISKSITRKVQKIAIEVYKAIGCRGFGRVDFILKDNKYPVVLEINTIPGLTSMSLLPKAAKAAGISYPSLIDKIIKYAIE